MGGGGLVYSQGGISCSHWVIWLFKYLCVEPQYNAIAMSSSTQFSLSQKTLQGVQTTFNSDRPENGLEALAQVRQAVDWIVEVMCTVITS